VRTATKFLQILVNLLHNAKYACESARVSDRKIVVRIAAGGVDRVKIHVAVPMVLGLRRKTLPRIFSHGFTTRKNGHGFGLHSGALARQRNGRFTQSSQRRSWERRRHSLWNFLCKPRPRYRSTTTKRRNQKHWLRATNKVGIGTRPQLRAIETRDNNGRSNWSPAKST